MSMPPWLRASIEPENKTTVSNAKPKVLQPADDPIELPVIEQPVYDPPVCDPVCIIAPTAEPKDTLVITLAEHDAKFHPNGLKPTEPCKFREAFLDGPAEPATEHNPITESAAPTYQEISATPVTDPTPIKKPHKKPGRKPKK